MLTIAIRAIHRERTKNLEMLVKGVMNHNHSLEPPSRVAGFVGVFVFDMNNKFSNRL